MVDYDYIESSLFKSNWELTELEQQLAVKRMSVQMASHEEQFVELEELKAKADKLWRWLERYSGPPADTYQETFRHWVQKISAQSAEAAEARSVRQRLERSFHYVMMKVSSGRKGFGAWDFGELPGEAASFLASLRSAEQQVTEDATSLHQQRIHKESAIDRHIISAANRNACRSLPVDAESHFGLSRTEIHGSLRTKLRILGEGIAMASVGVGSGEQDREFTRLTTDLLRRCLKLRKGMEEGSEVVSAAQLEDFNQQLELMEGIQFQAEKALSSLIVSKNKPLHVKIVKS